MVLSVIDVNWCNCKGKVLVYLLLRQKMRHFCTRAALSMKSFVYINEIAHTCMCFGEQKFK